MSKKQPGWDDVIPLWRYNRPESTLYVYAPVIKGLRNHLEQTPIQNVSTAQLQEFLEGSSKGQLPATVSRKISTIRSLFQYALKIGAIDRDPSAALLAPRVPDELASRILTRDEVLKIIDGQTPGTRDRVLLVILFSCGLRASEASSLKWADTRTRAGNDGQISVLGKGNKRRSIRLTPDVWAELLSIRPPNVAGERFVFESDAGFRRPLSRTRIAHIVRAAARQAGLEAAVSPHWFRHTHATVAMDSGAPLNLISYTLGHTSVATTSRYLHASPERSSTQYINLRRKPAHKT